MHSQNCTRLKQMIKLLTCQFQALTEQRLQLTQFTQTVKGNYETFELSGVQFHRAKGRKYELHEL